MYIVTTSKRIHQITALTFVGLLLMSVLSIHGFYQAYVAQPKAFSLRLQSVVRGQGTLTAEDVYPPTLADAERSRVLNELSTDLHRMGVPEADQGALLLLDQATEYLATEPQLLDWLHRALPQRLDADRWQAQKLSLRRWQIISGDFCLAIERHGRWQLAQFNAC